MNDMGAWEAHARLLSVANEAGQRLASLVLGYSTDMRLVDAALEVHEKGRAVHEPNARELRRSSAAHPAHEDLEPTDD